MEDLTLAIITVGSFAALFLVAIFADKAGASMELPDALPVEFPGAHSNGGDESAAA